jgi:FAD/FMN-containing dehydrogenase
MQRVDVIDERAPIVGILAPIVGILKEQLGPRKVKDDKLSLSAYSADVSPVAPQQPICVVFPETRDDVVTLLKVANETRTPVAVMSGGVNVAGACIPVEGGLVVDLRRMERIHEINTDAGYAVIEPGVNFDRFSAALAQKGFRCQIPTAPGGATPLGNYISRPAGSYSTRHLDSILNVEVVLADGTIFDTGSSAFPGAGAGLRYGPFPDLAGLFLCSYGTLGVITKASVRIYRKNEANRINLAAFDSFDKAMDFVRETTDNNIAEHSIIWNWQLYRSFEIGIIGDRYEVPPEVRLDPHTPPDGTPYNIVTTFMSGYEETMVAHEKVCAKIAARHGGRIIGDEEARKIIPGSIAGWNELYAKYRPVDAPFFGLGQYLPWIVFTEPARVKELEKWAVDEFAQFGTTPVCYYAQPFDFGRSVMFRIFCFPDPKNQQLVRNIVGKYQQMYDVAIKRYGGIPMRMKWGRPALSTTGPFGDVLNRIKRTLDPNNILSPQMGLFVDSIEEARQ